MSLLSSADFFQKIISGTLSGCQTVWIQIRASILSVPTCVQTVCNGYQQTATVATSKHRLRLFLSLFLNMFWLRGKKINLTHLIGETQAVLKFLQVKSFQNFSYNLRIFKGNVFSKFGYRSNWLTNMNHIWYENIPTNFHHPSSRY